MRERADHQKTQHEDIEDGGGGIREDGELLRRSYEGDWRVEEEEWHLNGADQKLGGEGGGFSYCLWGVVSQNVFSSVVMHNLIG